MAKIHKVEMYIVDVNDVFETVEDVVDYLNSTKYAPHIKVMSAQTKAFEWDDDLIINKNDCTDEQFEAFFLHSLG